MASRKNSEDGIMRVGNALETLPGRDEGGNYEVSTAFAAPARKRFMGLWKVVEHLVEGKPFLERFRALQLKGAELEDGVYIASYEFRENLCIKKVLVSGRLLSEAGPMAYEYRLAVALTWRPGPGKSLVVRPEMGYQMTTLDGSPAACRDLAASGEEMRLTWRLEGKDLVLEEGEDRRLLRRT
jgi:hypothetical protein